MPHATATFNGKTLAKAETWETVEGNIYVSQLLRALGTNNSLPKADGDSFRPRTVTFRHQCMRELTLSIVPWTSLS